MISRESATFFSVKTLNVVLNNRLKSAHIDMIVGEKMANFQIKLDIARWH